LGGQRGGDREGDEGEAGAQRRVAHHGLELVGEDEHRAEGAQAVEHNRDQCPAAVAVAIMIGAARGNRAPRSACRSLDSGQ